MADPAKKPLTNGKMDEKNSTYSFSQEELGFLRPRQGLMVEHTIIIQDLRSVMDHYVLEAVLPRLGLSPEGVNVHYNVLNGTFTIEKISPVIKPQSKVIMPN